MTPEVKLAIFDLDGTLIDSKLDLAYSVNAMLEFMRRRPLDHQRVFSYVGNGTPVLVRRALGPDSNESEAEEGVAYFIQHYREHCLDHTALYPGVKETIESLSGEGIALAVLTNKPVRISQHILQGLGVSGYFAQVYGGNSFERKKPDPAGIHALLADTGAAPENSLMVGDSAVDIRTARNAGIRSCGVLYGFQPETFEMEPPDFVISQFSELKALLSKR